jgi:predicted metal-dependent peptidase
MTSYTTALSRLVAKEPFFASYLYDMMNLREDPSIETAQTDGVTITVNPEWFGKMAPDEQVFVLAHEVMHGIYDHMGRGELYETRGFGPDLKPYDHGQYNRAGDYVINATLKESKVGAMPDSGLISTDYDSTWLVDDVYEELGKKPKPPEDNNGQGNGQPGNGFDKHLPPAKGKPSDAAVKAAVSGAMAAAKSMGNMPSALARVLGELIEPKIDWAEQLRMALTATAGNDSATWRKPNRRKIAVAPHIYMPSRESFLIGGVAICIDTSGSIRQEELDAFLSETAGILEACPPEFAYVTSIDTDVHNPLMVDDVADIESYKPIGGGGTNLEVLYGHLEDEGIEPETVIMFTDGYTSFKNEPEYNVIWVMTSDTLAPYGTNIRLDI